MAVFCLESTKVTAINISLVNICHTAFMVMRPCSLVTWICHVIGLASGCHHFKMIKSVVCWPDSTKWTQVGIWNKLSDRGEPAPFIGANYKSEENLGPLGNRHEQCN